MKTLEDLKRDGWQSGINEVVMGDCLDGMKLIPDKSIDCIICDLPYGTTACSWDTIIPFEILWAHYKRIIKDNSTIVLFGSQPFTSALIMSNLRDFRYEWIWNKKNIANPFLAKYQPLRQHENILVFGGKKYFPLMEDRAETRRYKDRYGGGEAFNKAGSGEKEYILEARFPKSILEFSNAEQKSKTHPTEKPVSLLQYLVQTYSKKKDLILDNCMGSWTTARACKDLGRNFIGFELEKKYCEVGEERLRQQNLF